jgi:phospholipase/carboxylesterase
MNRIALDSEITATFHLPCDTEIHHGLTTATKPRSGRELDQPYATFAPMHYEKGYAYPLLVWLHGKASTEQELRQVMPLVSMRNYVAIAPRGTWSNAIAGRTVSSRGRFGWRQSSDGIESAETRIADCIAVAKQRFNIHPRRIFLVGRGCGGTMAVRIAWNNPGRFAGVAAINGPLPTRLSPLRRVNELRQLPCLLTTSRDSRSYPPDRVCRDLRLLHVAGCTVALRQYPGADGLISNMLSDLNGWLMEIVCDASKEQGAESKE